MPKKLFPFYHQIGDTERKITSEMSSKHKKLADRDFEDSKYMVEYRRDSGWDSKARRGMAIYNVFDRPKREVEYT